MNFLGLGVDIVEYENFGDAGTDEMFLKRVFTEEEVVYCRSKSDPIPYLAARFAAKEAVIKALGQLNLQIFYSQIEIHKRSNGALDVLLHEHTSIVVSLSFSHGKNAAVAIAIAQRAG